MPSLCMMRTARTVASGAICRTRPAMNVPCPVCVSSSPLIEPVTIGDSQLSRNTSAATGTDVRADAAATALGHRAALGHRVAVDDRDSLADEEVVEGDATDELGVDPRSQPLAVVVRPRGLVAQ